MAGYNCQWCIQQHKDVFNVFSFKHFQLYYYTVGKLA